MTVYFVYLPGIDGIDMEICNYLLSAPILLGKAGYSFVIETLLLTNEYEVDKILN